MLSQDGALLGFKMISETTDFICNCLFLGFGRGDDPRGSSVSPGLVQHSGTLGYAAMLGMQEQGPQTSPKPRSRL